MTTEQTVRETADKILKYIIKKADEKKANLPPLINSIISEMKDVRWDEAYEKTMVYRILPDDVRMSQLKQQLPYLTNEETEKVKKYLDFIVEYAGL